MAYAHDQRDLDFANKAKLEVTPNTANDEDSKKYKITNEAYTGDGKIINSEFLNKLTVAEGNLKLFK